MDSAQRSMPLEQILLLFWPHFSWSSFCGFLYNFLPVFCGGILWRCFLKYHLNFLLSVEGKSNKKFASNSTKI